MSNPALLGLRQNTSSLEEELTAANDHAVYHQLDANVVQLVGISDERELTCDICHDEEDTSSPHVIYLRHTRCGRSWHALCMFEWLKNDFCSCPCCRRCLKRHSGCEFYDDRHLAIADEAEEEDLDIENENESSDIEETQSDEKRYVSRGGLQGDVNQRPQPEYVSSPVRWLGAAVHGDPNYVNVNHYSEGTNQAFNGIRAMFGPSRIAPPPAPAVVVNQNNLS